MKSIRAATGKTWSDEKLLPHKSLFRIRRRKSNSSQQLEDEVVSQKTDAAAAAAAAAGGGGCGFVGHSTERADDEPTGRHREVNERGPTGESAPGQRNGTDRTTRLAYMSRSIALGNAALRSTPKGSQKTLRSPSM